MALLDKYPCPRCKATRNTPHCGSDQCRWFICFKCTPKGAIVYNKKNHFVRT
jgi:hypothetical protein